MEIDYPVSSFSSGAILLSASTIVDVLYSQLSIADILSFRTVCKASYYAIKAWLPSAYNINNHLKTFFGTLENVLAFRSLQAATGTAISGSQALQFFDRIFYPDSDLDIYVPCRHVSTIGNFFLSIGYSFKPSEKQLLSELGNDCQRHLDDISSREARDLSDEAEEAYDWRFVEGVINLTKRIAPGSKETLKVQLIAIACQSAPLACILQFHSMMNLITHDRAYSLFPRATFIKRTGITIETADQLGAASRAYEKYALRNFKISLGPLSLNERDPLLVFGDRWVGDSQTWTITLDTTGVVIPNWVKEVTDYLGLPLLACQGFSVRKDQSTHPMVQHPVPRFYRDGNILLTFEPIYSIILHQPIILPVSDSRKRSGRGDAWTSYPATYKFILGQQRFEELKGVRDPLEPETVPGWQFWDTEVLQFVHKEYKGRSPTMRHIA
ncbi:hypothetical protein FRB91_006862 [Serendipita sp. 411]|nr:hypothetical protein FRB91_006862 [Serendipita sp. 411]